MNGGMPSAVSHPGQNKPYPVQQPQYSHQAPPTQAQNKPVRPE